MTCEKAVELFGDLVDEDIGSRDLLWLRLHLLICRHCRRYLAGYRDTIRAEKSAFDASGNDPEAEEIPNELVTAILDATRRR